MSRSIFLLALLFFSNMILAKDTLRVVVYDSPPFGYVDAKGDFHGMAVEIWEDIAADLGFVYTYAAEDMEGLLQGVKDKKYDVGLGAISITPQREELVDFSQAVNPSGTGFAFSSELVSNKFDLYYKPIFFSLVRLLIVLLLILFSSGTIVFLAERSYNKGKKSDRQISSIKDGLWWSAVTMTTVGYGDKVPESWIGRVLGMFWIFSSIIILSIFTANTAAILNKDVRAEGQYITEDLRKVKIAVAEHSSGEEFLIREGYDYIPYASVEKATEAVIRGEMDVVVSNVPVLKYLNNRVYKDQLIVSPHYLLKNNMGFALQDNSPLLESIDRILLKKIAEPKWQKITYKYLGASD